jgi:hypothetical protein
MVQHKSRPQGRLLCYLRATLFYMKKHLETPLPWLVASLILAVILLTLHLQALAGFWYWKYPAIVIPMHLIGGAALGSLVVGLGGVRRPFVFAFGILAIVVAWELFQYQFGISTVRANHYWRDTMLDMDNGFLGSLIPFSIARFSLCRCD